MDIVFADKDENKFLDIAEKLGIELKFASKLKDKFKVEGLVFSNNGSRTNFESRQVKMFFDLENHNERDFIHQRNSCLNQILAKIAHDKGKTIAFNFSTILNSDSERRAKILGRMRQNVRLCRKYKVKMFLGSFASNPYELRSNYELKAFGLMIGMNPKELKDSLSF